MIDLRKLTGFEWDKGNIDKTYEKHGITPHGSEEVFLYEKIQIKSDIKHQEIENRFIAIGKISRGRILFVIFTFRDSKIRIISSRIANKKERRIYEEKVEKNSKISIREGRKRILAKS